MNEIDCYVVSVTGPPKRATNNWWYVPVVYTSWGRESAGYVSVSSHEKAVSVDKGYHFLA